MSSPFRLCLSKEVHQWQCIELRARPSFRVVAFRHQRRDDVSDILNITVTGVSVPAQPCLATSNIH